MEKVMTVIPQPAGTEGEPECVGSESETLFLDDAPQTVTPEVQTVNAPTLTSEGRPDPQWVRGRCPECGDDLVSNMYYIGGRGYLIAWECWGSLGEDPACTYRRVL